MIDNTPEEDEAFSAMEQSSIRKEIIKSSKEVKLLMEVALLTDLVRQLADRVRQLEAKQ